MYRTFTSANVQPNSTLNPRPSILNPEPDDLSLSERLEAEEVS